MEKHAAKILEYAKEHNIELDLVIFENSVGNSYLSAQEANVDMESIVKTVLIKDKYKTVYAVIIGGKYKVDYNKIRKQYGTSKLSLLSAEEALELTGYPTGGIPPFGYDAIFLMDEESSHLDEVFAGGGNPNSLMKIRIKDILKASSPRIFDIKKT